MDRQVTSPTWGPPPLCKQALTHGLFTLLDDFTLTTLGLFVGKKHKTYRFKLVEQCHVWGDKTRAAYMFVWLGMDSRNHS